MRTYHRPCNDKPQSMTHLNSRCDSSRQNTQKKMPWHMSGSPLWLSEANPAVSGSSHVCFRNHKLVALVILSLCHRYGPQKLSTLAAYALRQGLLNFLNGVQTRKAEAAAEAAAAADAQGAGATAADAEFAAAAVLDPLQAAGGTADGAAGGVQADGAKAPAAAAAISVKANATLSADGAGGSPQHSFIIPAVRSPVAGSSAVTPLGPTPLGGPSPGPLAALAAAVSAASPTLRSRRRSSRGAGSSWDASPTVAAGLLTVFTAQDTADHGQHRHALASTSPAGFAGFAHGSRSGDKAVSHVFSPTARLSAAAWATSRDHKRPPRIRQRRSSPGHLEIRPQSAPADHVEGSLGGGGGRVRSSSSSGDGGDVGGSVWGGMLYTGSISGGDGGGGGGGGGGEGNADSRAFRGGNQTGAHAATAPLPRRLRTGSAGLTLERALSGITEDSQAAHGEPQHVGDADDVPGAADSRGHGGRGGGVPAAAPHRKSRSRAILRSFSNLARRYGHHSSML